MLSRIYPTQSEIRKKQINTLKVFNENVLEVKEDCEYQVLFRAGGKDFKLHVCLTKEFPKDKPSLRVSPLVLHPWVNSDDGEITSAPGLLNFSIHSDLGRVVQAIIREFERTPPPLVSEARTSVTSPSIPTRVDSDTISRASPIYFSQGFSPPVHSSTNTYQSITFPELSTMSIDELQFLNDCAERQEEFLDSLPQNKETNKLLDDLILQIEELADSNLNKRSQLEDLRGKIDERIEEVTKLVFETERLNVTYQNISEKYSPKNIKNKLLQEAEAANNESEKIAESFLQGNMDVDKFLAEFLQKRASGQMRKTKEEKLTQQLQNLERAGF